MTDMNDWNRSIIAEFRENDGKVGGPFEGAPMVLLTSIGAKSGAERVNPLMYLPNGDDVVIFASKGGAPTNPDWYYNLLANPEAEVELGTDDGIEVVKVRARVAEAAERDELWSRQKEAYPQFAQYEAGTSRVIPVVVLEKV